MLHEQLLAKDHTAEIEDTTIQGEIALLLSNSWPVSVSEVVGMMFPVFCLIAVGHVGEKELAGTGFGMMFCNLTGHSVLIGLSSGLETVASQLFGAGQHRLVGVALQRSFFVSFLVVIPIIIFWLLAGFYMPLFVEEDVAQVSISYVRLFCITIVPRVTYECLRRYLDAQGLFHLPMHTMSIALLLYAPLCWYLVVALRLGATGAAAALCAGECLSLALLAAYVRRRRLHVATWGGWTPEALRGVPEFLGVALPSCGMV